MKRLLLFFFIINTFFSFSQHSIGRGRSLVGEGLWSENVAGLANEDQFSVGFFVNNYFLLPELTASHLKSLIPTKYFKISVHWSHMGDFIYNEQNGNLSLARSFSPRFKMGLGMDIERKSLLQQKTNSIFCKIGMQSYISKELSWGMQLSNALFGQSSSSQISMSMSYTISKKTNVIFSAIKETSLPITIEGLVNYYLLECIELQLAISNTAYHNHFGLTLYWKAFAFDLILQNHSYLGFGPQIGLSHSF